MPFLIPTLILALGALILPFLSAGLKRLPLPTRWTDLVPPLQSLCIAAAAVGGLTLLALWQLNAQLPVGGVGSSWQPLALFGAPLTFKVNAGNLYLAMALVGTTFLSLVACCVSDEQLSTAHLTLVLAASGAGVAALFATSFVALIMTWSVTDILLAAALARHGQKGTRRAGLALSSGLVAIGALWAAPLLAPAAGNSGFLDLARFSGYSANSLQIAVILRLGLVRLHLWRPIDLEAEPAQLIPLVVIPTLLGFDLLTYLPALTAGLPSTLFALAAVTVLVGGFVAWSETEERLSLGGVIVAETGLAVLAVANAGQQAVAIAIGAAVAWALSVTIFALTPGWSGRYFWRGLPSLLASLSLIGVPATLGFVARFIAYSGLEADLLALGVALLGETFLVAAIIRLWFWAERRSLPRRRLLEPVYLIIFVTAAIALILTGLSPDVFTGRSQDAAATLPPLSDLIRQDLAPPTDQSAGQRPSPTGGVASWAGWALPLVAGVTLFLAGEGFRQRLEMGWRGLGALLRLEWVYGLFYVTIRLGGRLIRSISSVVEGEGALLWTTVILLIVLLYLTGGGGP